MATIEKRQSTRPATHPGKRGEHPLGGAVGAAVGGTVGASAGLSSAITAGAAVGSAAGAAGAIGGAVIGGMVGALAGKAIAEDVNPTTEDEYWREHHKTRPYVDEDDDYDTFRSAYLFGVNSFQQHGDRDFDEIESELGNQWKQRRGEILPWHVARHASRDSYNRLRDQSGTGSVDSTPGSEKNMMIKNKVDV